MVDRRVRDPIRKAVAWTGPVGGRRASESEKKTGCQRCERRTGVLNRPLQKKMYCSIFLLFAREGTGLKTWVRGEDSGRGLVQGGRVESESGSTQYKYVVPTYVAAWALPPKAMAH